MTAAAASQAGTFAAFNSRNYRLLFSGQAVSMVGTWMQTIAQGWLVLSLSHSGTALGLVVAAQTLPVLLFGSYGGLLADRFSKRKLLLVAQAILGTLALILGVLTVTGVVQLWMVAVLACLLGCVQAVAHPTQQSFVSELVEPALVRSAVTMNSVLMNSARAVGPAFAGALIAIVGTGPCFLINAASFIASITALLLMNPSALRPSTRADRAKGQLREGYRYVSGVPSLYVPLLMMLFIGTLAYEFQVVLPLIAKETFGGTAATYGWLSSAQGAGAVLGGLLLVRYLKTDLRYATGGAVAFGVAMMLVAVAPTLPLAIAAMSLVGVASIAFVSTANSTLQLNSDSRFRGRVMSLWTVAFLGSTPVGGPIVGAISEHLSPRLGLVAGGLGCFIAGAIGLVAIAAKARRTATAEISSPEQAVSAA